MCVPDEVVPELIVGRGWTVICWDCRRLRAVESSCDVARNSGLIAVQEPQVVECSHTAPTGRQARQTLAFGMHAQSSNIQPWASQGFPGMM